MSLADALAQQPRRGALVRCPIALTLQQLEQADQQLLNNAIADLTRTARSLAAALASIGHTVSADAVQRHRRGSCACEPR